MLKHVGRIGKTKRRVIVAYRVVPNEPNNCVVVTTENLMAEEHDTLMKLVESDAGQNAPHLATAMARAILPDGRNMLASFHKTGKMLKVDTSQVEMTPTTVDVIALDKLNEIIAEQEGVSVADLAPSPGVGEIADETLVQPEQGVLSDDDLAAQYRSQADAMFKEAKALREQAEELVPTKKKAAKPKSAESV
jgi:hypothetical protein